LIPVDTFSKGVLRKKFHQLREYDLSLVHAGISFRRNSRAEGLPGELGRIQIDDSKNRLY
jgi:hypothetical protein